MDDKKTKIKLSTGEIVDIGEKEKENLHKAVENQNPKEIVIAAIEAVISSKDMVQDLSRVLFAGMEQFEYLKISNADELINCDVCKKIANCKSDNKVIQLYCKKCGWWINY